MNATSAGNAPPSESSDGIVWIVVAAVVGFALLGFLGLLGFAALAIVLTGFLGPGAG